MMSDMFNELIVKQYVKWFDSEIHFAEVRDIPYGDPYVYKYIYPNIKLKDIFRTEMSKKWFNEFIEPLLQAGFRVHKIP